MTPSWDRCTNCVQSAAFPKIKFDDQGVCNFCRREAGALTDDDVIARAKETIAALFGSRPKDVRYDALMCYSGGKDSSYTLQLAVEQYGLRVLAFTLDNGFLSPEAIENIHRVVDHLGVDHLTLRPSAKKFLSIVRASALRQIYSPKTLTRISSVCNSCISIVNTSAVGLALEKGIPFILAGFTLGQIPANGIVFTNHYDFLRDSRSEALARLRAAAGDFVDEYLCLPDRLVATGQTYPTTINLLCVENVTESEIIAAVARLGWRSPGELDGCSSNCTLNTFNNHVHERAFGYNPYELELSHLIRKGLMTRGEAMEKLRIQPQRQLQAVLEKLNITDADLQELRPK